MLRIKRSLASLLVFAAFVVPAVAQEQCADFITRATTNIVQAAQSSNPNDLAAGFYHACAMTFKQYAEHYGASAKDAFLRFGGKGDFTERSFEEFKTQRCKLMIGDDARSAARFYFQQGSDKSAIDGWKKCMEGRDGLTCWVQPGANGSDVIANINWKSASGLTAKIGSSRLSEGNSAKGGVPGALLATGQTLPRGLKTVPIERKLGADLIALLTLEGGGAERTCSMYVPAALPQLPFDVAGIYNSPEAFPRR